MDLKSDSYTLELTSGESLNFQLLDENSTVLEIEIRDTKGLFLFSIPIGYERFLRKIQNLKEMK